MKKQFIPLIIFPFLFSFVYTQDSSPFKLGVENIDPSQLITLCPTKEKKSCKIGLITNQTGVDQHGKRTVDILQEKDCNIYAIFAPEHGLNNTLAGQEVHNAIDKKTNLPIFSLYGNGSGKMITADQIEQIDLLIFDIQDSGMRHYTYISTLLNTMKIAQEYHKPYIVLDRPNPLGRMVEGPIVEPSLTSFISIAPIPLRHGMTIGELALYFNTYILEKPIALSVVSMKNYDPQIGFMGKFIHQLSPNLQSLQSCYGYSFLGLLGEIEPFDLGIGTKMAFRCICLPESLNVPAGTWKKLQNLLAQYNIKSSLYHHSNPKNKRKSKGLKLEFHHINQLHAFDLFIDLLQFFKQENISFSFSATFNKAVGTADVQRRSG